MKHIVQKAPLQASLNSETVRYHESIQAAVDAANPQDEIQILPGIYEEKVEVRTSDLTIYGENPDTCQITYGDYARKEREDGQEYGTFRTYTFLIAADRIHLSNLAIINHAGDGRQVGQAVAFYTEGDQIQCHNCHFVAHQDTIFLGPLPSAPKIPGSFAGPSEGLDYERKCQYFHGCEITGDVDYIFGSGLALFEACTMVTRDRGERINGFVTAPSTWEGEPYGFVFVDCQFKGQEGMQAGSVFFGRPWREYGHVTLISCDYDETIHPDHFDPWGKESNKSTARLMEYDCHYSGTQAGQHHLDFQGEPPFIQISKDRLSMDFLLPWHQSMFKG